MAFDFCFDKKLFLHTTCRCCSRFFSEDVKFYKIFQEKLMTSNDGCIGGGGADGGGGNDTNGEVNEICYEPSEDIKEIFEDFQIWMLNIHAMDGMPQQICEECFQRFKQVHSPT
ncbi:uncharacterized protein [Musca autumnalis]|uniref:uncharacterized protein n=1 Tax=Musca autumnalis TaxID=221902 RepID=UPI003CEFEE75